MNRLARRSNIVLILTKVIPVLNQKTRVSVVRVDIGWVSESTRNSRNYACKAHTICYSFGCDDEHTTVLPSIPPPPDSWETPPVQLYWNSTKISNSTSRLTYWIYFLGTLESTHTTDMCVFHQKLDFRGRFDMFDIAPWHLEPLLNHWTNLEPLYVKKKFFTMHFGR